MTSWSPASPGASASSDSVYAAEVFVGDADALLGDACAALTGTPSKLLNAIDLGVARSVMSQRAFWELGWMSAKSARFHGLGDADLRATLEREYLPRIAVVALPHAGSGHWAPDATGVPDPDDVEHVQVARLISARMIYSHDKDLRRPGFAPATRADYDARIGHLTVLVSHRSVEFGVSGVATLTCYGATAVVSNASAHLNLKPAVLWTAMAITAAGSFHLLLAPPKRRQRIIEGLQPWLKRLEEALQRSTEARRALTSTRLITSQEPARIEAIVGAYLARHPDSNMSEIAEALNLNAYGRRLLSSTLREHPSFERASRYGWGVGTTRKQLQTSPPACPDQWTYPRGSVVGPSDQLQTWPLARIVH